MIVVKLDRLSRSLRDVCTLVEEFFSDERYHLLSLCGMVNTHSAAGRMVLMNLANYAQFEREMISERTRDALRHMLAQGVRLGPAPYGYEFSKDVDDHGRRLLVPLAREQEVFRKIKGMRAEGLKLREIARRLNEAKILRGVMEPGSAATQHRTPTGWHQTGTSPKAAWSSDSATS